MNTSNCLTSIVEWEQWEIDTIAWQAVLTLFKHLMVKALLFSGDDNDVLFFFSFYGSIPSQILLQILLAPCFCFAKLPELEKFLYCVTVRDRKWAEAKRCAPTPFIITNWRQERVPGTRRDFTWDYSPYCLALNPPGHTGTGTFLNPEC